MALESELILRVDQAKASLGELGSHGKATMSELGEKGGKEFAEKFNEKAEGIKGKLEGILGAVGLGLGGKEIFDLGIKGKETEQQLAIAMAGIGLHGKEAEESIKKVGEAAETNGHKYGIPVEKLKELTGRAVFLGKVSPETGSKLALMSAGIEKMSNGAISGEAALRGLMKPAGPEGQATIGKLGQQFPALGKALEGVSDPAKRADITLKMLGSQFGELANQTQTPLGKINAMKDSLEDAFINIGGRVVDVIGTLIGWFQAIPGPIQTVIEIFGGLTAAIMLYNAVMGSSIVEELISGAQMAIHTGIVIAQAVAHGVLSAAKWVGTAATTAATAAQWLWNIAMDANPIGAIIMAAIALGVAIYELVKHFDLVTNAVKSAWNWLGSLFGAQKQSTEATKDDTEAQKEHAEALERNNAQIEAEASTLDSLSDAYDNATKGLNDNLKKQSSAIAEMKFKIKQLHETLKEHPEDAVWGKQQLEDDIARLKELEQQAKDTQLAINELDPEEKKKKKPIKDEHDDSALKSIDNFIADKAAKEQEGRQKDLAESRKTYKEKFDALKKAYDEGKIYQGEYIEETVKLTQSGRANEAAINKKYDDEQKKESEKINEDFRVKSLPELQRKIALLEDEREQELFAAHKVGADLKQINKYYDDQIAKEKQESYNRQLENLLRSNSIEGAAVRAGMAGIENIENQGFEWINKRLEASVANQKTVWFGLQNALVKSAEDSLKKMAEKQVEHFLQNLLFAQTSLASTAAAMAPGMLAIAQLAATPASLVSVATLGAADIAGVTGLTAAVGAAHGLALTGYAKGGALIGERGPEIIAPMKDYSQGFEEMTKQITNTLHESMANIATNINVHGAGESKVTMTGGHVDYVQKHNYAHSASVTP